jgi:lipoic acid synthetase
MDGPQANPKPLPKPPWLKVRLPSGSRCADLKILLREYGLHTVCEEALCPNLGECWGHGRATVMILGGTCSRRCRFCNVSSERPSGCDTDEPRRVAEAVRKMGLREIVVTSVTRDDLPDGGAGIWAETIRRIRALAPGVLVEVLVPDFAGNHKALAGVINERPDVFGHNLETVPRLYPDVRAEADYARSLDVIRRAHRSGLVTKTSLMVGVGETDDEVLAVMHDAREAGADIFFIGQYLQPSHAHVPVKRYVQPETFDGYRGQGFDFGFSVVVSAPLVRSSYHAHEQTAYVLGRLEGQSSL